MLEQSVMEIVKWFLAIFLIFCMVAVGIFCFQVQDVNSFKQHVNYQIERRGGLTEDAVKEINKESKELYKGRYEISSNELNKKVKFGETVDYNIKATIPIQLIPIDDVVLNFKGSGVSQVR